MMGGRHMSTSNSNSAKPLVTKVSYKDQCQQANVVRENVLLIVLSILR